MSSVENDEKIIFLLEQIDNRFSMIRGVLREIKGKVKKLAVANTQIINDCEPWIRFFENDEMGELHTTSSVIMTGDEIKNPFSCENGHFMDNSIVKTLGTEFLNSNTSNHAIKKFKRLDKENHPLDTEGESAVNEFNTDELPDIFRNDTGMIDFYDFIRTEKTVDIQTITQHFHTIPPTKISIYIRFLTARNYIKKSGSKLTVE